MTKKTAALLVLSIAVNVLGALAVLRHAAANGVQATVVSLGLLAPPGPALAELAHERYGGLPGEEVVVFGDSHAQEGPFSQIIGRCAMRGLEGQTIDDATAWVEQVLYAQTRRLIVILGTNDAVQGRTRDQAAEDYRVLISTVRSARPDVHMAFLTVPPVVRFEQAAADVNSALLAVAEDADVEVIDVRPLLTVDGTTDGAFHPSYTRDGIHLSGSGYARITPLLREAAGG